MEKSCESYAERLSSNNVGLLCVPNVDIRKLYKSYDKQLSSNSEGLLHVRCINFLSTQKLYELDQTSVEYCQVWGSLQ